MKVIIVGAGIAGMCSAWSLTKMGHDVTLIEQGPIPNPLSASGDQHRLIRLAYGDLDNYARAIPQAFEAWEELWADLGETHYVNCGILALSQLLGDEGDRARDSLDRHGGVYRTLMPAEAAERFPYLDPARFQRAYLTTEGGVLLCQKIGAALERWLGAHGATLRPNSRVVGVDGRHGVVTLASGEALAGDRVVVTAGAWTPRLFPALELPLKVYRTTAVYLDPPHDLKDAWASSPGIQTIGGAKGGYALPPVAGTELKIAAGCFRRPAADPDADRVAETAEGLPTRALFGGPLRNAGAYRIKRVATCAYTFTDDNHFFLRSTDKVAIVSACSGHGFKFGAAVGRWIARAIDKGDDAALSRWLRGVDASEVKEASLG